MNEYDITKNRSRRPRHQDAVWMHCFTAALSGSTAAGGGTPKEVVAWAMEIADEACDAIRQEGTVRITGSHQPPRDRNYLPGHIGHVKPAKT